MYIFCVFLLILNGCYSSKNVTLGIENKITNETSKDFVSYTVDFSQIVHKSDIDLNNKTLQYLALQLSPSWLRVGGTQADYTYYQVGDENPCHLPSSSYHCLSMDTMQEIIQFSHNVNAKLIFGLSIGYPLYPNKSTSSWNYSNTQQFLTYLHKSNYTNKDIFGFQLGNELNSDVSPSFQSKAFHKLNSLLIDIFGENHGFSLHGPDAHSGVLKNSKQFQWVIDFIAETCDILNGISYHCKVTETATEQLTAKGLQEQYNESLLMSNIFNQLTNCSKLLHNVWPSEIAEEDDGTDGYTNAYYDGFWYLNAMGSVASLGQIVFARQTLGHNLQALLKDKTLEPYPDYYTAVLFNQLMGNLIIETMSSDDNVRLFGQCVGDKVDDVVNGVTVGYVNVYDETVYLEFDINILGKGDVYVYILESDDKNSLSSEKITMNGKLLKLNKNNTLPNLNGMKIDKNKPLDLPGYSYGFIVFTDTIINVCSK